MVGHNEFSDWPKEEFDSFLSQPMSVRTTFASVSSSGQCVCSDECGACECNDFGVGKADSLFDWRDNTSNPLNADAVNKVVDQGNCSASWAFAAIAMEET